MPVYEIDFDSVPSNEQLRQAIQAAGLTAYRIVWISPHKLTYQVESIDIDLRMPAKDATVNNSHVARIIYHCIICGSQYQGWRVLPKAEYPDANMRHTLYYCPQCPSIDINTWAAQTLLLYPDEEKPILPGSSPKPRAIHPLTTLDIEEFE